MTVSDMEDTLFPFISDVVQEEYPGAVVTHWSATVAVMTPDGTELVIILDKPGQAIWQSFGLEKFASEMRTAAVRQSHRDDDEV